MKTTEQKIDAVLAMTKELSQIKNELALLHEHEATLNERAERCIAAITGGASPMEVPGQKNQKATVTLAEMVTLCLTVHAPRPLSAIEIASDLGIGAQITSIRGTLSRLSAEGRIQKVGYGKYTASVEGTAAGVVIGDEMQTH